MSELIAYKYGGTSAAQPEVVAADFGAHPEQNRVAIMSAVGKDPNNPNDIKGTQWLGRLESAVDANSACDVAEAQEAFIEKNRAAYGALDQPILAKILDSAYQEMRISKRYQGYQWIGERVSAQLFAALTDSIYVPSGIVFKDGEMRTRQSLRNIQGTMLPLLASSDRQIVTEGFIGTDMETGHMTTLPPGGSDISAVIVTAALNGQNGQKWVNVNSTDKDGILSADPGIVPNAQLITDMTHEEVREKMHGITERNGVIHGDAIAYASTLGVEITVRNTFNPASPGTKITATRESSPDRPVVGISGKSNVTAIDLFDMGMADASGYFGDVLTRVGKVGASVATIPKSEDRLKLVLNGGDSRKNVENISGYMRRHAISGDKAEVEVMHNQGAVFVVGEQLRDPLVYTRTLGTVAHLLASEDLAIREVVSHEKSPSLAMTVDGDAVTRIIRLLHKKLIES